MDLCDERRLMIGKERHDLWNRGDEVLRQQWEWHLAYDNEERSSMTPNSSQLVGLVPDSPIMGDRDPALLPDMLNPSLIGAVVREEVMVSPYRQSG